MNRMIVVGVLLACFASKGAFASREARAETYHVGAARENKTLGSVLPNVKAGDVVEIDAGEYRETAKLTMNGTSQKPIIFRGVGATRPVFDARDLDTSGRGPIPRGIFQIEGAYIVLEHLEIKNARNGENAAGVRLLASTNAVVRDCVVSQCDMGIFGDDRETATIEDCDIGFSTTEKVSGYAHNFYMHGNRVVVRRCHIHDALWGQNYKSRAHYNELWFNWIENSNEGEVGIVDSDETAKPNSNALLVGNIVLSKADRSGNTSKFVLFGSESGKGHNGTLFLFHNTFIAGNGKIRFITLDDPQARAVIANNLFRGSDQILNEAKPAMSVEAARNFLPSSATAPAAWSLEPAEALAYVDGDGAKHLLNLNGDDKAPLRAKASKKP